MDVLEPQLRELLQANKECFKLADNGKIECTLNGHTLPPRLDAVSAFIQGAKFQKLARRQAADQALQKYEPFIVQSKNFPLMLYCALTGQLIDKSVEAVKKHMKGKKFQRAKDRFAADELELKPEPSLESFGIKTSKPADEQQQQQVQQQANGAAGSDEEPEFWVPVGAEESGDEEGGSDDDEAAAGSSSGDGDDDAMEAGPLGSDGDDPMDEDSQPAEAAAAAAAAAAAVAAAAVTSSSKAAGKAKTKQGGSNAGGKHGAQNGAAAGATKKRNAHKPSAAKKVKL